MEWCSINNTCLSSIEIYNVSWVYVYSVRNYKCGYKLSPLWLTVLHPHFPYSVLLFDSHISHLVRVTMAINTGQVYIYS